MKLYLGFLAFSSIVMANAMFEARDQHNTVDELVFIFFTYTFIVSFISQLKKYLKAP